LIAVQKVLDSLFADYEMGVQHGVGWIYALVPAGAEARLHQGDRSAWRVSRRNGTSGPSRTSRG